MYSQNTLPDLKVRRLDGCGQEPMKSALNFRFLFPIHKPSNFLFRQNHKQNREQNQRDADGDIEREGLAENQCPDDDGRQIAPVKPIFLFHGDFQKRFAK